MTRFRRDFGLAFADENRSMRDKTWRYDSRKKKWTVDLKADPKHLDLFELSGGTQFTLNYGTPGGETAEETLFRIEHKMPFPPEFLCFFYMVDAPFAGAIGGYSSNSVLMLLDNDEGAAETIYATVDDTYFYIKHYAEAFGNEFSPPTITFFGSDYLFRVRYELLNQPALYLGTDKGL